MKTVQQPRLAIDGGPAVRSSMLPYARQAVDEQDIRAVTEVLRGEWITTGPKVDAFEREVADKVGARHAVSFSSGTAALHAAVFAAGLGHGDEAITSPLSFCATANALLYQGVRPLFADVCEKTLTLDPDDVSRRMTPKVKAILPVDYGGHPADLDALLALAQRHGLIVIEDACHALGARLNGRRVGGISHMTVFSFHPVKHITTGEGGMVTTNDPELARRLRLFRNHGIDSEHRGSHAEGPWYYEMVALGFNYRLTDIGCALGLSQLRRLSQTLARRRWIAARYTSAFHELPGITLPASRPGVEPAWHLYVIRVNGPASARARVFESLRAEGLGVNVHYIPIYWHPYYQQLGYQRGSCPRAEAAYAQVISLPLFPSMAEQDVQDVISAVRKVTAALRQAPVAVAASIGHAA